jgi:hypothetical protein
MSMILGVIRRADRVLEVILCGATMGAGQHDDAIRTGITGRVCRLDSGIGDIYDALIRAYLHICDTMCYQAQVGAGDHGLWEAEEGYLGTILNSDGGTDWLSENSDSVSAGFRQALDAIRTKHSTAGSGRSDSLRSRYGAQVTN